MKLREAMAEDAPFLWIMLTYASSMVPNGPEGVPAAQADPNLVAYVEGWPRPDELGVVAEAAADGTPLGAAWLRLFDGGDHPHMVATREVPELAIGVVPDRRGQGIGARLLEELFARAEGRYPAIVLSVREANPSRHLYERVGFVVERSIVNRSGSTSLVMRRALTAR